jgi:hypothetical protein
MKTSIALLALAAATLPAAAVTLAESRFDGPGADGWLVKDLRYPDFGAPPVVVGTYDPTWNAGGFLSHPDPGNNAWYWLAPAAYLGDQTAAYGGSLSWEVAITGNGFGSPPYFTQEDVILVGAGRTLVQTTGVFFTPTQAVQWRGFEIGLTAGDWRIGNDTGPLATEADLRAVLGALDAIYLRGEYLNALDDIGRLDNVVLTAVPEPAAWALMLAGVGTLLARRRAAA